MPECALHQGIPQRGRSVDHDELTNFAGEVIARYETPCEGPGFCPEDEEEPRWGES